MDNVINVFMNYKIERLTEYAVLIYNQNSRFIKQCLRSYFRTYVDNYYYNIFNTIDGDSVYSEENLRLEFKGIMEEMLYDYREFELQVSNEEYSNNRKSIYELKDLCLEVIKMDFLTYKNKDDVYIVVNDFIKNNEVINSMIKDRHTRLVNLVKESYSVCQKMLNYEDHYFNIIKREFVECDNLYFLELDPTIKVLDVYKKSMIARVYKDNKLDSRKIECLIQKISLELLRKTLNKEKIDTLFLEISDTVISRGRINNKIMCLIDNPLFRKYVVLVVNYNTYLNQKTAFTEDFEFACIQDFSHINDIYQKTDSIYNEGIFNYLIVSNFKDKDIDFFANYENEGMRVLLFKEE